MYNMRRIAIKTALNISTATYSFWPHEY